MLVTVAAGRTGREVVRTLAAAGADVWALAREPRAALEGAAIVGGDFDDPASLRAALAGVQRLFLLTPASERQVEQETSIIEAARERGIERIVKLSWTGSAPDCPVPFGVWHWESESRLLASGVPCTIVRAATFMQHLVGELFAAEIRAEGVFRTAAGDGRVGLVDIRDVAAVAAKALLDDRHDGAVYAATGPAAHTFDEVAAAIAEATGRPVEHRSVHLDEIRLRMVERGAAPWFADAIAKLFDFYRDGGGDTVSDDVERLTGARPIALERFVRDHLAAFEPGS